MNTKSALPYMLAGAAGAIVASIMPLLVTPGRAETKLLPFQGRLTDAAGSAVADGARVVEFKMYDAPTGGTVKWAGEVHKLTVNGGLVNTMLGSKASLGSVDFSTPTYLQITVDAQAAGAPGSGAINAADPPLLPRQSVVPAVYAAVSGEIQYNAGGAFASVKGADLFDSGGKLKAPAIAANDAITSSQLASNSVDTSELKDGSVTAAKLGSDVAASLLTLDSVLSGQIKDGEVREADLHAGAVSASKLAADVNARLAGIENRLNAIELGKWTPLFHEYVNPLPMASTQEVSHPIPASIPSGARQFLVYAALYTGSTPNTGTNFPRVDIYTKEGTNQFVMSLGYTGYPHDAVPFNSSTQWLPITADRFVFCKNTTAFSSNTGSRMIILGYR